jgi:hypothetical protein
LLESLAIAGSPPFQQYCYFSLVFHTPRAWILA